MKMDFYHMADFGDCAGKYKGMNVFPIYKSELDNRGTGAYYIIVDDNNKLVRRTPQGHFKEYGWVCSNGDVETYDIAINYKIEEPAVKEMPAPAEYAATIVADVALGIAVDDMLKSAREMTVDLLLEGFNYGLD